MRCIGLSCDSSESDSSFTRCLDVGLIERNDIKILSWVICEVYAKNYYYYYISIIGATNWNFWSVFRSNVFFQ